MDTTAPRVAGSRGKRKKRDSYELILIPSIFETEESSKDYQRNWARLIQKIYEVDPLTCPKCSGKMKVIPRIAGSRVKRSYKRSLSTWDYGRLRPDLPPKANSPPMTPEYHIDYTDSQLPVSDNFLYVDLVCLS